jgi:hypothetical protein
LDKALKDAKEEKNDLEVKLVLTSLIQKVEIEMIKADFEKEKSELKKQMKRQTKEANKKNHELSEQLSLRTEQLEIKTERMRNKLANIMKRTKVDKEKQKRDALHQREVDELVAQLAKLNLNDNENRELNVEKVIYK